LLFMVALWNRADHYVFIMWFLLLSSFFPRLISAVPCRLDVCHTSTHGVVLVQIYDVGLKRAARGSLQIQDAKKIVKNLPPGHHRTNLSGYIFVTKARIDDREKNLLSSNISLTRPHNMMNSAH